MCYTCKQVGCFGIWRKATGGQEENENQGPHTAGGASQALQHFQLWLIHRSCYTLCFAAIAQPMSIEFIHLKWNDTTPLVKEECLTGGASTTPTPIMTSDPVTHCLSLQLKSYSLLSDLLNKVTHCLSTSHTSGILCWPVTQSSTLPLYLPKQPHSLFSDLLHTV